MPDGKKQNNKKISLHPLSFEDALRGLLQTEPPPKEQKDKPASKRRRVKGPDAKESKE